MSRASEDLIGIAFRVAATNALLTQPTSSDPGLHTRTPRAVADPRWKALARRPAGLLWRLGRPLIRPFAFRWRAYLMAPMRAELAEMRAQLSGELTEVRRLARPRSVEDAELASTLAAERLVALRRQVCQDEPLVVWVVDGQRLPNLTTASQLLRGGSTLVASSDLRGLTAIADPLAAWARGISQHAHMTLTIEFGPAHDGECANDD